MKKLRFKTPSGAICDISLWRAVAIALLPKFCAHRFLKLEHVK